MCVVYRVHTDEWELSGTSRLPGKARGRPSGHRYGNQAICSNIEVINHVHAVQNFTDIYACVGLCKLVRPLKGSSVAESWLRNQDTVCINQYCVRIQLSLGRYKHSRTSTSSNKSPTPGLSLRRGRWCQQINFFQACGIPLLPWTWRQKKPGTQIEQVRRGAPGSSQGQDVAN